MKTKFLSLFLSLIMVLSCFGAALPVFAEGEGEGSGSTEVTDYDALAVEEGYVARIGTAEEVYADGAMTGYYKSFAPNQKGYAAHEDRDYSDAMAAAKALGKTTVITLLTDLEFTYILSLSVECTIDGNGHTVYGQYNQKIVDITSMDGEGVTVKNLKIWQKGQHGPVQITGDGARGTFENCYILGTGVTTGGVIVNNPNQSVTLRNCTIKIIDEAPVQGLGMTSDTGVRMAYDNQTVVMENCLVDCSQNFGGSGCHFRNASANYNTNHNSATLTNCVVIGQAAAIDAKDTNVTINGGTFISTLGASKSAAVTELVYNEDGTPVWKKAGEGETADAEGNLLVDGQKVQATQTVKIHHRGEKDTKAGSTKYEYTAYENCVINKGRGGNFELNGTVKFVGGVAPLKFADDDNAKGKAENLVEGTTSNVDSMTYAVDEDTLIWRDTTEAAKVAEGYVAFTMNADGTKTYYKSLSPADKDYVAADKSAMELAPNATIYLMADVDFRNAAAKDSDLVISAAGAANTANAGAKGGHVNSGEIIINGMGFTINMCGYLCTDANAILNISNATITTTATGRHMIQANATSTVNLDNVGLVAKCKLDGGFFVARGTLNFDDVTWTYEGTNGSTATQVFHLDQTANITLYNCIQDSRTNAPAAKLFMKTVAGTNIVFSGATDLKFAKYGMAGAGTGASTITVKDYAKVTSDDNVFYLFNKGDVLNVTDNAQVTSTAKDAIKLEGEGATANITGNAIVKGGRNAIRANGKNASAIIGANATVELVETSASANAVLLDGEGASVTTKGTVTSTGAFPAINASAASTVVNVYSGTVTGTVSLSATATINMLGGVIDAGTAAEAIVAATGATSNLYEGTVKDAGGEDTYNEMSSHTPTNGAVALRMNAGSEGIRYNSSVSAEVLAFAKDLYDNGVIVDFYFGTAIVRDTEITVLGTFSIDAFAAAGVTYANIVANESWATTAEGGATYSAAIVNPNEETYGVTLLACAYVAYELADGTILYYYAENIPEEGTCLADLAKVALSDVKDAPEEGYMNKVSSYYEADAKGKLKLKSGTKYSPYSIAQQALLTAYIDKA